MNVAIVHYWLVGMRGGEKVVEALCEMFPDADVFTHVCAEDKISAEIRRHDIRTTFISRLPFSERLYRRYLALMPLALQQLDLRGYDLVISSESGPAKGVLTSTGTLHVCYCHSPMRYVWDLYHEYRRSAGPLTRLLMPPIVHYLRQWDRISADRVDRFVANSENVRARIRKHYRRDADVVHPPVDTDFFVPSRKPSGDFYLFVGQLIPYKRPEVAVEAFNRLGRRLVVIGKGQELDRLRRRAEGNIEFRGWQAGEKLQSAYANCRALVFPGEEDFGIVPVEAMAAGRPVIALGRGGARETVVDGTTGVLFDDPSPAGLVAAIQDFEAREKSFDADTIRAHARRFDRDAFMDRMARYLERAMVEYRKNGPQLS